MRTLERVWEVYRCDCHPLPSSSLHPHLNLSSLLSLLLFAASLCFFLSSFLWVFTILDPTIVISLQHMAHLVTPPMLFITPPIPISASLAPLLEICGRYCSLFVNVAHAAWHAVYYALLCTYSTSTLKCLLKTTIRCPENCRFFGRLAERLRSFNFPYRLYKKRGL